MEVIWEQFDEATCTWKCTNGRWPKTTENLKSMYYTMIATHDMLTIEKCDKDAKGIRDQMLPMLILMLFLLAEVLVPINNFYCFLQTKSLNYSLINSKFPQVMTKLHKIKENLPNYDAIDVSYLLKFSEITLSIWCSLFHHSRQIIPVTSFFIILDQITRFEIIFSENLGKSSIFPALFSKFPLNYEKKKDFQKQMM